MIDISQGEIQVTSIQPNDSSKKGVGKDWAGPFSPPPPPKCSDLTIYLSVFQLMLFF